MNFSFLTYFWQPPDQRTAFIFCGKPLGYSEKTKIISGVQLHHHGGPHGDAAGPAQLSHGPAGLHGDAGGGALSGDGFRQSRVGVAGQVDPAGPSLPDGLPGLLHAHDSHFGLHRANLLVSSEKRTAKFTDFRSAQVGIIAWPLPAVKRFWQKDFHFPVFPEFSPVPLIESAA